MHTAKGKKCPMLFRRANVAWLLMVVATFWFVGAWTTLAQEAADPDVKAAEEAAQKAAGAGQPAAAASTAVPEQNLLQFYFSALGWRYTIAFLAISFTFVALIVMNLLALRRESVIPTALIEGFEAHINEKKYQEAYDLAKADESFLGRVLTAGMERMSDGYPQSVEAMQEVGEDEAMKLEHRLSYIALIGTVSPMVGLLGTVDGMVGAFREIVKAGDVQPKPSRLAEGISMALITTLVGLVLAIPAVGLFGILRNRLGRLTLEVGIISERLMNRVVKLLQKKAT